MSKNLVRPAALAALAALGFTHAAQAQQPWDRVFVSGRLEGSDPVSPAGGRYDIETFAALRGPVSVSVAADGFSPLFSLYRSSDGQRVSHAHGEREARADIVVPDDDVYLLAVTSREGAGLGPYRILVTPGRSGAPARAVDLQADVLSASALNADIQARNDAVQARNDAAKAVFEQAQAKYRADRAAYEAEAAAAAAAKARYERDKAAWEAKVAACKAGDHAQCAP